MAVLLEPPVVTAERDAPAGGLVTHCRAEDDRTFEIAARWPREHGLFGPVLERWHNPLLAAEIIRQSALAVAHTGFAVPRGARFLMWNLKYTLSPVGLRVGPAPTGVTVRIVCRDVKRSAAGLSSMRATADLYRGTALIGRGETTFTCVPPQEYERLCGVNESAADPAPGLPAPVSPALVGLTGPAGVLLAPTGTAGAWQLRVDRAHPALRDPASDAVPGMALMEAMRQAAQLAAGCGTVLSLDFAGEFTRYVRFDRPARVTAEVVGSARGGGVPVHVAVEQDGELAAFGTLRLQPVRSA